VVGGGHNGLVAAGVLAGAGLDVTVLEARDRVGGASVTERPFASAPDLGASTGAYLLGLMPPEIMVELGLNLPLIRRDPHYFLPTASGPGLLLGSDAGANARELVAAFGDDDLAAMRALDAEIGALRDDLAPAWLAPPLALEETAERYVRADLRQVFVDLCRDPVENYLDGFGFKSGLLRAMYAVTDGFSGLDGGPGTPGTGHNFLVHNMCRLPGAGGTWMIVKGGMGTVTAQLAAVATRRGAVIRTGCAVARVRVSGGQVQGIELESGEEIDAEMVLLGCDPLSGLALVGDDFAASFVERLRGMTTDGTTLKVNLCLDALPSFTCRPGDERTTGPTVHLLPQEGDVWTEIGRAYRDACEGRLADFPTIEWYTHTTVDPSLRDVQGRHSGALFVQWAPAHPEGGWDARIDDYVEHLLGICDRFAPGTSALVSDVDPLPPPEIERRFGIRGGHIHHVSNRLSFADRLPYETPVEGLYFCGAGCHPAGSVIGAAGYNAAHRVLAATGGDSRTAGPGLGEGSQ
jgi:phytoene dehydrogenase-like protein